MLTFKTQCKYFECDLADFFDLVLGTTRDGTLNIETAEFNIQRPYFKL